jgi:hypothetical protein
VGDPDCPTHLINRTMLVGTIRSRHRWGGIITDMLLRLHRMAIAPVPPLKPGIRLYTPNRSSGKADLGQNLDRLLGFEVGELGGVFDEQCASKAEGIDPNFVPTVTTAGHK